VVAYTLLGPLGVEIDGRRRAPSAAKPRALLALLVLNANRQVPLERIIDELWPERPPETAAKAVQTYVSQLRKLTGEAAIEYRGGGYRLTAAEGALDLERFEKLVEQGQSELAEGEVEAARETLVEALGLWRGGAIEDVDAPFAREAAARLEEERLAALESRLDCDLRLGRHDAVAVELTELVEQSPGRERLVEEAMLALYRSGRQADALALYRSTRRHLVEEQGIEPRRRLQELERAILQQDPSLDSTGEEARPSSGEPAPARRDRRLLLAGALALLALAVGATLAIVLTRQSGDEQAPAGEAALRPFVVKLEGFIAQSGEGRTEIAEIARTAGLCQLSAGRALVRLASVERNRQSLLDQVAALSVPDSDEAVEVVQRFQQAVQASIASDWHYHEWLSGLRRGCSPGAALLSRLNTRGGDARATTAKQAFVEAFNPLARRFGLRTWAAGEL
jgi:DNA-binding SARP family transcriptional activator